MLVTPAHKAGDGVSVSLLRQAGGYSACLFEPALFSSLGVQPSLPYETNKEYQINGSLPFDSCCCCAGSLPFETSRQPCAPRQLSRISQAGLGCGPGRRYREGGRGATRGQAREAEGRRGMARMAGLACASLREGHSAREAEGG